MNYLKPLWDLYQLKRNVYKPREEILALQAKKLKKILRYAYERSPYYHETFIQCGIDENNIDTTPISAFPTIDKSILLHHFDRIVTVADLKQENLQKFDAEETLEKRAFKGKYHLVHSSGSTGKPGYFVYDNDAWNYMLVGIIRAALWNMTMSEILKFLSKKPHIMYVAATDGRYGGAMAVGDGIDGVGAKQMFLDVNTPISERALKSMHFSRI